MRTPFSLLDVDLAGAGAGSVLTLDGDTEHHLRRVLRRSTGDAVDVADGRGWWAPAELGDGQVVTTSPSVHDPLPAPRVTVVHAVPKGRGLDDVVRTCTELGVAEVVPVMTERGVVRLAGERASGAVERWQAIADAAAGQARRATRCAVGEVQPLTAATAVVPTGARLVAHPSAAIPLGAALRGGATESLVVAVGPEGGFTDQEIGGLVASGWVAAHMGRTVLRSVHAAPVIVAASLGVVGRFDDQ